MRYALQVLNDPEESTRYRLKAAEIVLDAGMPKNQEALALAVGSDGIEFLELRFVAPGNPAAAPERIALPLPVIDVEANETSDVG